MWPNPSQAFLVTSYLQLEAELVLQFVETEVDQVKCLNNQVYSAWINYTLSEKISKT